MATEKVSIELERAVAHALYEHTGTMWLSPDSWPQRVRAALERGLRDEFDDPAIRALAEEILKVIYGVRARDFEQPSMLKFPESSLPAHTNTLFGIPVVIDPEMPPGVVKVKTPRGWEEFTLAT